MIPNGLVNAAVRTLEQENDALRALIQWLALPYEADPVFLMDGEGAFLPGYDPEYKQRLQATWERVVGTKGPAPGGMKMWAQCKCCGHWACVNVEEETVGSSS